MASNLTVADLVLTRRELTRMTASVTIGAAVGGPNLPFTNLDDQSRSPSRAGVGAAEIDQLETAAEVFRSWDDTIGGGLRRKAVIGQLHEVADLVTGRVSLDIRGRLFVVLAGLSETAAMMSWDIGLQGSAWQYYALAYRFARLGDDSDFAANILAAMARQLLYAGKASEALDLVQMALNHTRSHSSPALLSMLCVREAWAHSSLGDIDQFRRCIDAGFEELNKVDRCSEPSWIAYFDQAEMHGTIGGRLLEMARVDPSFADEACDSITQAIRTRRPDRLRSLALDQLGLAEALVIGGHADEAVRVGGQALDAVERTPSDRVKNLLTEFQASIQAPVQAAGLSGLRDRVEGLTRA